MRLKKTVTNSNTTYCIIRDYTNLNGKRSTCVFEALGNDDKLKERFGTVDTMNKVQEYIDSLNQQVRESKESKMILELDPNRQIEKDVTFPFLVL